MAYSVRAHFTVDGPWQREIEFHRVCSRQTLDLVKIGENAAALRLKTITAMLLEEMDSIRAQKGTSVEAAHAIRELETAYNFAYAAMLHAQSALNRSDTPAEVRNVEAFPISA